MKKFLSVIAALSVMSALTIGVSAADSTISQGEQSIDVQAKFNDGVTTETVYSVDVSWGAMEFTYSESGSMTWNPDDHTYTDTTVANWTAEGNTVTVINHSNADVDVSFEFGALSEYENVTGSFDVSSKTLKAGVVNEYDSADKVTSTLTLSGEMEKSAKEFTKVGTVTITIA